MKIQCEQCKIEYNIDDAAIGERGIRAQCPRCNFITTIRKSQPAILDAARSKLDSAICVNCGKSMEAVPGDPIPICPTCQAQSIDVGSKTNAQGAKAPPPPPRQPVPSRPTAPSVPGMTTQSGAPSFGNIASAMPSFDAPAIPGAGAPGFGGSSFEGSTDGVTGSGEVVQWRIKKSPNGEVYGPFDRELIQGWIDGEKIVPADEISRVGGPWRAAGEHEDFAAAFAARYGGLGGAASVPATNTGGGATASDVRKTVGGSVTGGKIVSPKLQSREPLPWKSLLGVAAGFALFSIVGLVWYTGAVASLGDSFRGAAPTPVPDLTDKMIDALRGQYPSASGTAAEHLEAGKAAAIPDTVEAWTAARTEFAQALAIERKSAEALALVAEMNALLATYDQQRNLLDEALRFGVRATEWDPASAVAARARAAALLAAGSPKDANDARALLEATVVPAMPDDPVVLSMLGRALIPTDPARAEQSLKKAMEKGPTLLRPRVELGLLYEQNHRYQKALEAFRPVLDRSFLAAYQTGKIDENVGAYREAAAAYKIAAQVAEPNGGRPWADAVISYAVIQYQALGNTKDAAAALAPLEQKYLQAGTKETLRTEQLARLRLHLAILARLQGNYARSIELSRAVIAGGDLQYSAAASFNIGLASLRNKDLQTADKALDEANASGLDNRSQSEVLFWHGIVKMQRSEIQPAESAFEDSKKEDGQNWRAVIAHAALLGLSGERDIEAMAKMEDLALIDPLFYDQYQKVTLFFPDPTTELLTLAQKTFTRIHTATHGTDARSSTGLAIIAYFGNNRVKAQQAVTNALAESSTDPAANVFAGLLAEQKGGKAGLDKAMEYYMVAKSDAPSAFLSTAIGRVELQRGNAQKGETSLQDALNRDPGYAPALYWLGVASQKKGDSRQAIAKWSEALKHDKNFVKASKAMFDIDSPSS